MPTWFDDPPQPAPPPEPTPPPREKPDGSETAAHAEAAQTEHEVDASPEREWG